MKILEKDHWSELILDSVGDDFEKATEYYKQYKLWQKNTIIEIALGVGIFGLVMLGIIFGFYWAGMEMSNAPDESLVMMVVMLWMGAVWGASIVLTRDNLPIKLRKRKDNIAYHWEKTEGEKECK